MITHLKLISKLPLIITVAPPPESCKVNRQYGVGDSKYVVTSAHYTSRSRDTAHTQYDFWPKHVLNNAFGR